MDSTPETDPNEEDRGAAGAEPGPAEQASAPAAGIFANLPSSRPGMRSRKPGGEQEDGTGAAEPPAEPSVQAQPDEGEIAFEEVGDVERTALEDAEAVLDATSPSHSPRPPRGHRGAQQPPAPGDSSGAGPKSLGDAAWAGVAVAAQTAAFGVRAATRVIEAMRGAERR